MQKQDGGMRTIRTAVGALSVGILAFPAVAAADEAQQSAQASQEQQAQVEEDNAQVEVQGEQKNVETATNQRALGGFIFQPPALLESPFVTNHIRVDSGVGMLKQDTIAPQIGGSGAPSPFQLRLGVLEQRAGLGLALTPNIGLRLDGGVATLGGANHQSAITVGNMVAFDLRPGLKFGLVNNQALGIAVGLRAYGIAARAMGMRPTSAIESSNAQTAQAGSSAKAIAGVATGDAKVLGGGVALSAAKNIGKHVGVQAEVGGEAARIAGVDDVQGRITADSRTVFVGTAASVDLSPVAPLGAMVEYRVDHAAMPVVESSNANIAAGDVGRSTVHSMAAGLYYTGQENLAVGVVGTYCLASGTMPGMPSMSTPAQLAGGRLTVGYFF